MANKDVQVRRDQRDRDQTDRGMFELMPEFQDVVQQFFGPSFNSMLGDWPAVNQRSMTQVHEDEKSYVLTCEVPGIPQKDIDINVNGNLLTIRANHNEESRSSEGQRNYRRQSRSFQQSFSLPTTVDADKIEAHCENGVLEIMLPKTERAQAKKIEVKSGEGGFWSRSRTQQDSRSATQQPNEEKPKH